MPLSKSKMRELKQKERVKPKSNLSIQDVKPNYPAILEALVDPIKRVKLKKIHESLRGRGLLGEVRYGVYGPTFDIVGELLEVTS